MCMATLIPANVEIPERGLINGSITNDDGHGYAIASTAVGMSTYKSMNFYDTYDHLVADRVTHGANSVVLFHSRFGTHGEYGPYNIHPFEVGAGTVMAHNGIMPFEYHPQGRDRRSDTRVFADQVASMFCKNGNGVPSRRGAAKLASVIGGYNKLVFLSVASGKPTVRIVNSASGQWVGGVWYSNDGFRDRGYYKSTPASKWDSDEWWARYDAKVADKRDDPYAEEDTECPICGSLEVDLDTNQCLDCEFCLDCQSYADECICYVNERWAKPKADSEVLAIEDCADDGWVKIGGVWCSARSAARTPEPSRAILSVVG